MVESGFFLNFVVVETKMFKSFVRDNIKIEKSNSIYQEVLFFIYTYTNINVISLNQVQTGRYRVQYVLLIYEIHT